jgi:spore coat protein JA
MNQQFKTYEVYSGPFDPCPPKILYTFVIPPNVYSPVQPYGLPQFPPREALHHGTLWPAYYSPYPQPAEKRT